MGFRRYLQFLSAFSRLVLILSGFTGSSFPDVKPEEYVCLDDRRWRQVRGIIVVDILQLESLGRMNGLNQGQGRGEGGVGSEFFCA